MRGAFSRAGGCALAVSALMIVFWTATVMAQAPAPYVHTMRVAAEATAVPAPTICRAADGWLYTYGGGSFRVVDLADPVAPVVHGQLDGLAAVTDFVVAGSRAYLGLGAAGLTVLDLADRAHPQVAGTLVLPAPVAAVALYGTLVAVAGGSTFSLVDAADPQAMSVVGSGATIAVADLAIVGDHALVTGATGIATLSLAVPAAPLQVALFQTSFTPDMGLVPEFSTIEAAGARLAVRSRQWVMYDDGWSSYPTLAQYVISFDASDPTALASLGGTRLYIYDPYYLSLSPAGRVMVTGTKDLVAYDTEAMQFRGLVPGTVTLGATAWVDRYLYAARGTSLAVYDLAYPETVLPFATWGVGFTHTGGSARFDLADWSECSGSYCSYYYRIFDTSDPATPLLRYSGGFGYVGYEYVPDAEIMDIEGNHILLRFVGGGPTVLSVLDMAYSPVAHAQLPYWNAQGCLLGDIAWVLTDVGTLVAVDCSALPSVPVRAEIPVPAGSLFVQPGGAGLLDYMTRRLTLLDLADPYAPQVCGAVTLPAAGGGRLFRDGFAYVSAGGLQVIDVSDLQAPTIIGSLPAAMAGSEIAATGDTGVIASTTGFQLISLVDPAQPQLLSPVVGVPDLRGAPVLKGDRLYVGHGKGMYVYDVSNPAAPAFLGSATGVAGQAYDGGDWIVVPGGAYPLDGSAPVAVDEADRDVPAAMALRGIAPNPFNPRTTVSFAVDRESGVEIAVYDLRGAKLRTLVTGRWAAGEHTVDWDGRCDDGRPLASGTYVVRMRGDGGAVTGAAKVTLVR